MAPTLRPMIAQAQAAALMRSYDTANNKANAQLDSTLIATIEDGDPLAQSRGSSFMSGRLGAKPYEPFTLPNPLAFVPAAGAYPRVFFAYSKHSKTAKANVLSVFRSSDAAAPWKKVISGSSKEPLPPIAVDPSGMATLVTSGAGGYAVKPIDVAPLLAKAMLSARACPEGAKFATSPIPTKFNAEHTQEQAKGKGTVTPNVIPTKDIYAVKTKDGGGTRDWRNGMAGGHVAHWCVAVGPGEVLGHLPFAPGSIHVNALRVRGDMGRTGPRQGADEARLV